MARVHVRRATALLAGLAIQAPSVALADNPIVQTNYTADPAPFVHDDVLYVYTTHDEDQTVNDFFTMNDWRVYSTTDVVNWTDHGSPLHYSAFSFARGDAWAGQVIHRNGTFYFYVPFTRTSGGHTIGVATSSSPLGPFEDALGVPLVQSDCGDIDPTVFIDGDGQAYLYWGNPDLCYVRLNEDMVSYSGDVVHVPMTTGSFGVRADSERPTSYEEGPWLYERSGLYYMVFAAGPISEHIGYATAPSVTGPWSYGGVVMPTQGGSFTNHPGVAHYKGASLFFYHNGALPGGGGFKRSVCVEDFTYAVDGSIPELTMTMVGAAPVDVLNPFARTEGETIAWESGIETEVCSEGGMNVTEIDDGDHIAVREVAFGAGADSLEMRVASASGGGGIELRLDDENGALVGTCNVEGTGGDDVWATQTCPLSGATGTHDLYLRFTGGGFKLDWWKVGGPGDPGQIGAAGAGGQPSAGGAPSAGAGGVTMAGTGGAVGNDPSAVNGAAGSSGSVAAGGNSGVALGVGGSTLGTTMTGGVVTHPGPGGSTSTGGVPAAVTGSGMASDVVAADASGSPSPPSSSCSVVRRGAGADPLAIGVVLAVLFARVSRRHRGRREDRARATGAA